MFSDDNILYLPSIKQQNPKILAALETAHGARVKCEAWAAGRSLLRPEGLNLPGGGGRKWGGVHRAIAPLSWLDAQEAGPLWGPSLHPFADWGVSLGHGGPSQLLVLARLSFPFLVRN